jgi:membrane associated rhomboid family serine protease
MNHSQRTALFLRSINEHAVVWCVLCVSGTSYLILQRQGLHALAPWFLPTMLHELLQELSLWRLWTPTFVHYTLAHLLTNLYLWWLFARAIESESRRDLIVIVLISAAASNALQWWLAGPNFGGLSGVLYALLSYRWLMARYGDRKHYQIDSTLGLVMLALLPLAASGIFGKFADFAHIGGLLSGAALAAAELATRNNAK